MTERTLPNLDVVDEEFLKEAPANEGPWVSILLPTHRTGRESLAARSQFQNLLKIASAELEGHDSADEVLAPLRELVEQRDFWLNQSDGLAVYSAPGLMRTFRVPAQLPDEVSVGAYPRLAPLATFMSAAGGSFDLLALSGNSVKLFEGTRGSIGELSLGEGTPTSLDEVLTDRDRQPQLQHSPQSAGGGVANFHGHGGDSEISTAIIERFFRQVAAGVDTVLGRAAQRPMILAGVAEHGATFRSISSRKNILAEMVTGNPERLSDIELHERAWPIAEQALRVDDAALTDRYNELVGTGKASDDVAYIAKAAAEGRVETLLVPPISSAADGQPNLVVDEVDELIALTLRNRGTLAVSRHAEADGVRAIFRY